MLDVHQLSKKAGNQLPRVLPQVTMDKVSTVTQNEILNVLVENEYGIPIAETGPHRSFFSELMDLVGS